MTTNKDIYSVDEKAIILGVLPEGAPEGYAILIKVTGPDGDCASQNILPGADSGFRSKPLRLDGCGVGTFTVSAFYADQLTNSSFTISNSSRTDSGSKLELRTLKEVMLQALDVVNSRVKELVESGITLPEDIADRYSEGVSEASLALQAIEFGDAAEAKAHMIFSIRDFRQVLSALSENTARFEQAENEAEGNSDVVGTYDILQRKYYNFLNVAEKNGVDKESEFGDALRLLSNAKRMIDTGNYDGAGQNLRWVNALLEEIRAHLYDRMEEQSKRASAANSTDESHEKNARRLTETAAKYERVALELLNGTANPEALAKAQEALSLVKEAKTNIAAQEIGSARDSLRQAYWALSEAQDLAEEYGGNENNSEGRGNDEESEKEDDDRNRGNSDKNDQ